MPGAGELAVFCGALVGAALGFLWFNAPPAMVFMGDTGSLSLGGALGAIAVVDQARAGARHHRRPVRARDGVGDRPGGVLQAHRQARLPHGAAAPSFREDGLAEPTIVIRFWIIASILALVGLSTLKLR